MYLEQVPFRILFFSIQEIIMKKDHYKSDLLSFLTNDNISVSI